MKGRILMKKAFKLIPIILILAICLAPTSLASSEASSESIRASDYLVQYDAYIITNGYGNISIWFDVTGTRIMDEIACK